MSDTKDLSAMFEKMSLSADNLIQVTPVRPDKNRENICVRPMTIGETALAKYRAKTYIDGAKNSSPELDTPESREAEEMVQTLFIVCSERSGKQYFDSVDSVRKLATNFISTLWRCYNQVNSDFYVSENFSDKDFQKLKAEVKKNASLLLGMSPDWVNLLCFSFIEDLKTYGKAK